MQLIEDLGNTLVLHNEQTKNFITDNVELSREYKESHKDRSKIGFNVFKMASEFYYRENFHSFIISAFLNPADNHNEGNKFLHLFIDLLNLVNHKNLIDKSDFLNSNVYVEKYKIDILITDDVSKKAIIIENKINNAIDQFRQLPRYVEIVEPNYKIEGIVYLTLNSAKKPDKNGWTDLERESIDSLLKLIPVFDANPQKINLLNNWINPSLISSHNINVSSTLRQYGELIKYLNTNTMDTVSIKKFFDTINEDNNLETAISIRNMLNDLPQYLAIRIEEKYKAKCSPFANIWRYKDRDTVFEGCSIGENYFKLDVWCSEVEYGVLFWESKKSDFNIESYCKENNITAVNDFQTQNEINKLKKSFKPLDEKEVFNFIDTLLTELKNLKSSVK